MNALSVVVMHQALADDAPPDEQDVLQEVNAVCAALERAGHNALPLAATLQLQYISQRLHELRPHVVFNLVESLNGSGRFIGLAPILLEELGLPFTGAGSGAMHLTSNKLLAKHWLTANGLPTPAWQAGAAGSNDHSWIVKSVWEHASIGMDDNVVVHGTAELQACLADKKARFGGEWFCERYVPGREFNLSLLQTGRGVRVLPLAEIVFDNYPPDKPQIVGYQAKWDTDSFEYLHTRRAYVDERQEAVLVCRLQQMALRCWEVFQLSGYARVDFRLDPQGQPWILEVNANPCLSPDAGLAAAAKQGGLQYDEMIALILNCALPPRDAFLESR